jgi:DNA polymerase-1
LNSINNTENVKPTVVLVDGTNLFYRAFFAAARATVLKPGYLEAHMFFNSVLSNVRPFAPCAVIICWDRGVSKFRKKIFPEYKEHRKRDPKDIKRMAMLRSVMSEITPKLGVYEIGVENVEADDLIAYFYHRYHKSHTCVIVSGDGDLSQFSGVILCNLNSHPRQVTKMAAKRALLSKIITGDKSDNIQGIPKHGPAKATKILDEVGLSFESVLGYFADSRDHTELLLRNRQLCDLKFVMPLVINDDVLKSIRSQMVKCYRNEFNPLKAVTTLKRMGLVKASDPNVMKQFKEIKHESDLLCRYTLSKRNRC